MIRPLLCAAALLVNAARVASAETPPRKTHGNIGAGGFVGLTGVESGPAITAEVFPGPSMGRFGVRAELRGNGGLDQGQVTAGIAYEAAAARPHLLLVLHGDIGLSFSDAKPVFMGGLETHLWILGPLALVTDATASLLVDGAADTVLTIAGTAQLRLAW